MISHKHVAWTFLHLCPEHVRGRPHSVLCSFFFFFPLNDNWKSILSSSLSRECISPNKKAFTRLIKRHCTAECNAQFTLYLILPLVLFNFIQNQSVELSSFPMMWAFLHQSSIPGSWPFKLLAPAPFGAFPIGSSAAPLTDWPFLSIPSLDVANSGQRR